MNEENTFEKLSRLSVPGLDEILGVPFRVLDDGFVRVIDYMGSDEAVVQAARVSYGNGTKKVHEDRGLIRYLLRHRHTTPFEMCEIKLHIRVPMDTWRQWIRHRTANVNEYSTRYSLAIDSAQMTDESEWRLQSGGNRQGSAGFFSSEEGKSFSAEEKSLYEHSKNVYLKRIESGMAREQARKDLPLSTYTEAYWKTDLHNLLHFLALRMDEHAQLEIRKYAILIGEEIVKRWCPVVWEAFMDYSFHSDSLSRIERELIRLINSGSNEDIMKKAAEFGFLNPDFTLKKS
ncbi:MAG TPA: FAD-dependent thymidylate synthase, partial [Leptospiraceae bacterium]|nr:FAD-dependent thymidylate synthase [Leptospiraceae bacterium]